MTKNKKTKKTVSTTEKKTVKAAAGSDTLKSVWLFDKLDRDGVFRFDINRDDFSAKLFLDKMISYSNMTWQEIKQQTHDNKRSKNHYISAEELSKEAQNRIKALHYEEYADCIFSFAFENMIRIFGIRENEYFHVVWYDPKHEICPVKM